MKQGEPLIVQILAEQLEASHQRIEQCRKQIPMCEDICDHVVDFNGRNLRFTDEQTKLLIDALEAFSNFLKDVISTEEANTEDIEQELNPKEAAE